MHFIFLSKTAIHIGIVSMSSSQYVLKDYLSLKEKAIKEPPATK